MGADADMELFDETPTNIVNNKQYKDGMVGFNTQV